RDINLAGVDADEANRAEISSVEDAVFQGEVLRQRARSPSRAFKRGGGAVDRLVVQRAACKCDVLPGLSGKGQVRERISADRGVRAADGQTSGAAADRVAGSHGERSAVHADADGEVADRVVIDGDIASRG